MLGEALIEKLEMARAKPLTLADSLVDGLVQFATDTTHTDVFDKLVFRRLFNESDRLQQTNVVYGSVRKAFLCSTVGDFAEVEKWLKNAEQNNGHDQARIERFTHYVNHGYATKALALVDQIFSARMNHKLMDLACGAAAIGAFNKIVDGVADATARGEVLQMTNVHALATNATEVMRLLQVSDSDIAAMLDVAGEHLRENKLLWENGLPDITVLDEQHDGPALLIAFRISVSPQDAVRLSWRMTDDLVNRGLDRTGLNVDFIGTKLQEKLAA